MKRTALTLIAILFAIGARADEGMWLPSLISQRIVDMQEKGCRLSAEDIYSVNEASLKDAVVLFGRGCTGELISPEGLLLTNHHCGYSQIQKHSSVEHDYLRDGFWAMTREEELKNEGLTVRFLERMEDVTDIILKGYDNSMDEKQRNMLVRDNASALLAQVRKEGNGIKASVEKLYYGNQYFLFVYREYTDIRLVGAPPSAIGKFGGDTDNWMWPRHTGDFSIFRIYADKNNNPAEYSEDNVPYKPKKYFHISTKGIKEGDFTMVYGFPGRTQEYIHSEAVRYIEEVGDPHKIALRTLRLDIMNRHQSQSQKVRIQYSSKHAGVANAWKKWQGEVKGLRKMKTVAVKKAYEAEFARWAKGGEFDSVVQKLDSLYLSYNKYQFLSDYYDETVRSCEVARFALSIHNQFKADGFDSINTKRLSEVFFKDYYMPIDKEIFVAMMSEYGKNVPEEFKPDYFQKQISHFKSVENWAEWLFSNTIFTDPQKVASLSAKDKKTVEQDPAFIFHNEFTKHAVNYIMPEYQKLKAEIDLIQRDYMRGQIVYA